MSTEKHFGQLKNRRSGTEKSVPICAEDRSLAVAARLVGCVIMASVEESFGGHEFGVEDGGTGGATNSVVAARD